MKTKTNKQTGGPRKMRKESLLDGPRSDRTQTIGVDIGGTKIYIARYNSACEVESDLQIPTSADKGRGVVFGNLVKAIEKIFTPEVAAIGVAWAGFIDAKTGSIVKAPNIPNWIDVPLADDISHHFEVPAFVENDARLFTLAEQRLGTAKDLPNVIGLIVGTGVGSGVIINGEIYSGSDGYAGEVGHMIFNLDQKINGDPLLEAEDLFSGPGLEKYFAKSLGRNSFSEVEALCKESNQAVCQGFERIIDKLAIYLYNLMLAYNPDTIVFGGGIGKNVIPLFKDRLIQQVQHLLEKKHYPLHIDIRFSELGNSGALGAALYAQENFISNQ